MIHNTVAYGGYKSSYRAFIYIPLTVQMLGDGGVEDVQVDLVVLELVGVQVDLEVLEPQTARGCRNTLPEGSHSCRGQPTGRQRCK